MSISPDAIKEFSAAFYASSIFKVYGEEGVAAMKHIISFLNEFFKHLDPEVVKEQILVYQLLPQQTSPLPLQDSVEIRSLHLLSQENNHAITIEYTQDGRVLLWRNLRPDIQSLAGKAVIYRYQSRTESFIAGDEEKPLKKLNAAYASNFCIPTFSTLSEALEDYKLRAARHSSCPTLSLVWASDRRILLREKPEKDMRRSLTWFLKSSLGAGFEVRPEQVVDESHPVDIKVTRMGTNRLVLIEIKWMGDSVGEHGKITCSYRDQRAKDGAQQLADYLDANLQQAPQNITRGYLVIVDARRRGASAVIKEIDRADGMFYETKDVQFDPAHHESRSDFEKPYRMFVEPVCR